MKPKSILPIIGMALLLVSLPYVVAVISAAPGMPFGGFLLNPLDGNSYLAKMREGWQGAWTFQLPFTAQPGEGSAIFLFYLFLGHLARWLHIPLLWMFHIARCLSAVVLVMALTKFFQYLFCDEREARYALLLAVFGSGLGWIVAMFGGMTADFWVAEAYPFLAMYANPHFPLALALILVLLTRENPQTFGKGLVTALLSLLLAVIQPFGVVVVGVVLTGVVVWNYFLHRPTNLMHLMLVALGGAPMMVYQLWLTRTHPALMVWNAQNVTLSPALWDLAIALLPALVLAIYGAVQVMRNPEDSRRMMVVWLALGLVLMYLPVGLQRRFMLGIYIPAAGLAVTGLAALAKGSTRRFRRWFTWGLIFSVITNILVIASGLFAGVQRSPEITLREGEMASFEWLAQQPMDGVVLSSPDTGLLIPAYSGRRVLYGHPYETVNATEEERFAIEFFEKGVFSTSTEQQLQEKGVTLIYAGPRERELGDLTFLQSLPRVYDAGGVTIYAFQTND